MNKAREPLTERAEEIAASKRCEGGDQYRMPSIAICKIDEQAQCQGKTSDGHKQCSRATSCYAGRRMTIRRLCDPGDGDVAHLGTLLRCSLNSAARYVRHQLAARTLRFFPWPALTRINARHRGRLDRLSGLPGALPTDRRRRAPEAAATVRYQVPGASDGKWPNGTDHRSGSNDNSSSQSSMSCDTPTMPSATPRLGCDWFAGS